MKNAKLSKMTENVQEISKKVIKWANDRGIIQNGNSITQGMKLVSEMGELAENIRHFQNSTSRSNDMKFLRLIKDDIGDMMVVLTILAEMKDLDFYRIFLEALANNAITSKVKFSSIEPNKKEGIESFLYVSSSVGDLSDNIIKGRNIEEDLGGVLGNLFDLTKALGIRIDNCYDEAYNDIKDRKGYLNKDGVFVKEGDVEKS